MDSNAIPCYGRISRALFLATHRPITLALHRRARRVARAQKTYCAVHDVWMEEQDDGTVLLLPADAMPVGWRTLWRRLP